MANIKYVFLTMLTFVARVAYAQYCVYQDSAIQINHYACEDNRMNIVVYKYQSPKDLTGSYFYSDLYECNFDNEELFMKLKCSDNLFGVYELVKKSELDTTLCVCENCMVAFVQDDSVILSSYHPLKNIKVFFFSKTSISKIDKKVSGQKFKSCDSHINFVTIPKRKLKEYPAITNKCYYSCHIPHRKGHCFLYISHPDYQVSELIEVITPPI